MYSYQKTDYSYVLRVGEVNEIRAAFKALHDADAIVNDNMM